MAGDDWNQRELDRGVSIDREVERLRKVYAEHTEALSKLAASAPSRHLARRYQEIIGEINKAIASLGDVDPAVILRKTGERPFIAPPPPATPPPASKPAAAPQPPASRAPSFSYVAAGTSSKGSDEESTGVRIVVMIGLALVLLGILGVFVWKFSGERTSAPAPKPQVTAPAPASATSPPPSIETVAEAKPVALRADPEAQDFGTVYKGTRVVKTFEVVNGTESEVTVEIGRSKCRCLWFDHPRTIPPAGRITLAVTVDGSKAPSGFLAEKIQITARGEKASTTTIDVSATIR